MIETQLQSNLFFLFFFFWFFFFGSGLKLSLLLSPSRWKTPPPSVLSRMLQPALDRLKQGEQRSLCRGSLGPGGLITGNIPCPKMVATSASSSGVTHAEGTNGWLDCAAQDRRHPAQLPSTLVPLGRAGPLVREEALEQQDLAQADQQKCHCFAHRPGAHTAVEVFGPRSVLGLPQPVVRL